MTRGPRTKALITGITGQDGSYLTELLSSRGTKERHVYLEDLDAVRDWGYAPDRGRRMNPPVDR